MQRDPLGYVDSVNLSEYVASQPLSWCDPLGFGAISTEGLTVTTGVVGQVDKVNSLLQQAAEAAKSGLGFQAEYLLTQARAELEVLTTAGLDARTQEVLMMRAAQAFSGVQRAIAFLSRIDMSAVAKMTSRVQSILGKIFNAFRDHLSDPDIRAAIDNLTGKIKDGHLNEVLSAMNGIRSRINELNAILQRLLQMKNPPTDRIEAVKQIIAEAQAQLDKIIETIRAEVPCFVF
jgi:hypothetical protein